MDVVLAIDAGTTSVRVVAVSPEGRIVGGSQREFTQYFPRPGWVEHDPNEIWTAVESCLRAVVADNHGTPVAIGITNQRETAVLWDDDGAPVGRAIVWQDRRSADICAGLAGQADRVRALTGLVIDPYFTATKLTWLAQEEGVRAPHVGTVDSWLAHKLCGRHVTDPSNASRTLLYDIHRGEWSDELCDLFGVDRASLPEVVPSAGEIGRWEGIPVAGIAGDQQAALFGNACVEPGMTKNTYGTGSFVLVNAGREAPVTDAVLTTIAWDLGDGPVYALEGSIFSTGSAVQWLRDGLGLIEEAGETGPLAASVPDSGGVYLVPAFTGLGAPYWDPAARGAIFGLTRGTTRAHLARAVVEAMAYQTRDVIESIPVEVKELRVDGGGAVMDLLCQIQADQLQIPVRRPLERETTALGAAFLAGLAVGLWPSPADVMATWKLDRTFEPSQPRSSADQLYQGWQRAVSRVTS